MQSSAKASNAAANATKLKIFNGVLNRQVVFDSYLEHLRLSVQSAAEGRLGFTNFGCVKRHVSGLNFHLQRSKLINCLHDNFLLLNLPSCEMS